MSSVKQGKSRTRDAGFYLQAARAALNTWPMIVGIPGNVFSQIAMLRMLSLFALAKRLGMALHFLVISAVPTHAALCHRSTTQWIYLVPFE